MILNKKIEQILVYSENRLSNAIILGIELSSLGNFNHGTRKQNILIV